MSSFITPIGLPTPVRLLLFLTSLGFLGPGAPAEEPRPAEEKEANSRLENVAEQLSERVGQTVDETAAWIDSRFGDLHPYGRERAHGYLRVVPLWIEHRGWEVETRFRARVDLPNIDRRLHAVFGAGDPDNFITERPVLAELEEMSMTKERFGDRSFLAGLGYSLSETKQSSLRFSAGAHFRFPIEPYVRGRYIRLFPLSDATLVRFHQTLYARTQRGQGSVTGLDMEHILSPRLLARGTVFAHFSTWDERPQEFGAEVSLARALSQNRVVAVTGFTYLEPKHDVSVQDYGVRLVYRQRLTRKHLYGELHTGVTWPRYTLEEKRQASLNLGVGLELHFGDRPPR